jgi:hypothetical protein
MSQVKRQASLPDLFSATSKSSEMEYDRIDGNETDDSSDHGNASAASLEEEIVKIFLKPEVFGKFVSAISSALSKKLDQNIDRVLKSVNDLEKTVKSLNSENKQLKKKLSEKDSLLENSVKEINNLKVKVSLLKKRMLPDSSVMEGISAKINDQEQHGRRNSLRFHNLRCTTHDEVTNAVIKLATETIGITLTRRDIVHAHMIGPPRENGTCQAIVRFVHYWKRAEIYRNKSKLKGNEDRVFITEDLTVRNMSLMRALLELRKNGKIDSVWSSDGRIFYKAQGGERVMVKRTSDIPA